VVLRTVDSPDTTKLIVATPTTAPTTPVALKSASPAVSAAYEYTDEYGSEPPPEYDDSYFSSMTSGDASLRPVAASPVFAAKPQAVTRPKALGVATSSAKQSLNTTATAVRSETVIKSAHLPDWTELITKLNVRGLVKQLAQQSELLVFEEKRIELRCENRALASNVVAVSGMEKALAAYYKDAPKTLKIHVGSVAATPAKVQAQVKEAELVTAQSIIAQDATVQALVREFDGMILPGSIKPI
jgi:hypothetical protein